MHSYRTVTGVLAGVLAFVSFIPYFISIFKGKTRPHRATFAIWSAVNLVTISSYIASGARTTIFTGLVYTSLQLVIFALSFKYGMGGLAALDIACLLGATVGLILWVSTKNPHIALYLSIFAEVLGFIPTLKKSYLQPHTESTSSWTLAAIASVINLLALSSLKPEISAYPIYNFIGDTLVAALLLFPTLHVARSRANRR